MVLRKPGFRYRPFACALWTGLLAALPAAAAQGGLADLAARYRSADAQLQKHVVDDQWLDAKPDSPQLLAKRWDLAGEWMAAWRDGHPQAAAKEACAAFAAVVGKGASCGALTIMEVGTTPENARDCATLPPPPAGEGWGGGKSHRETQPPSQPSPASGGATVFKVKQFLHVAKDPNECYRAAWR
ncbi:MAG: hypothetical protein JSR26_04630 [Proteobacteria bacterium]|nr:hypothetical protein [Pseudomonadota bacterium]